MRVSIWNLVGVRMWAICLAMVALGTFIPLSASAEGRCPPGQYPIGGQGIQGCAPIPGGGAGANGVSPRPTGKWETRWGAIAEDKSPSPGAPLATGAAVSQKSKRAASSLAMDECRKQGGNKCEVRLAYYNQCAAIADPGSSSGVIAGGTSIAAHAETLEQAKDLAVRDCKRANGGGDCTVSYSACSMSEFRSF
jgi:hypothetical protein